MNIDFTAVLAVLTLVTGCIWLLYVVLVKLDKIKPIQDGDAEDEANKNAAPADLPQFMQTTVPHSLVRLSRFLFPVVLVVLVVRGFLVEPFQIPSGSMLPTLEAGDYILVNKFAYGLRTPLGYHKILDLGKPKRGDVIVFRYPEEPDIDYIKRVVGVPGDRLRYDNKTLYVNGKAVALRPLYPYTKNPYMLELKEELGDVTHNIIHDPRPSSMNTSEIIRELSGLGRHPGNETEIVVPAGHYFVLGDNRDYSKDSRFWGFVPDENLKGRAFMIWLHRKEGEWPSQWSRIGTIIE